jgi:DNA-binding XRE family transcriptional regulator
VAGTEHIAAAWHALGRQLAASRRATGLSQDQLAPLAGYSRSTVANVETGRQHVPRDFWKNCDEALNTGNALAHGFDEVEALTRRAHEHAEAIAKQGTAAALVLSQAPALLAGPDFGHAGGVPPGWQRIELLRQGLSGVLSEGALSEASLDEWEQAVARYGRATRDRPATLLITDLAADLAELREVIGRCRSASSLRRLARISAQMSGLMCLLFVKLGEPGTFRRWARTARLAAAEAGDPATYSWVLAQEAYGHYYSGDPAEAEQVARRAQDLVRAEPCAGAALAAAVEARASAVLGDRQATRRALCRAETVLSKLDGESASASAFGYTESQLRFHEGSAYTNLHDTKAALRAQERALQLCPRSDYTDWALTRLDHASCLACDGDTSDAVSYATQTLNDLNAQQRQGIIALRGREIVAALPPRYQAAPAVRELAELARPADEEPEDR